MSKTHLQSKTRLYKIWAGIKKRCLNKKSENYYLYGGRGVRICDSWELSFQKFWRWAIKNGYNDGLQIDRIKNSGNYSPNNCRWVTQKVNANNKRNNLLFVYNGKKMTLAQILRKRGLIDKYGVVHHRMRYLGWTLDEALTDIPYSKYKTGGIHRNSHVVRYNGKSYSLIGLCRKLGMEKEYCKIKMRINKLKWPIKRAFSI